MRRDDFRQLSRLRKEEADALHLAGKHVGAFYLAGYSVECSLKSAIITHLQTSDEWKPITFSKDCWSHGLKQLIELAVLHDAIKGFPAVYANWSKAINWSENVRYNPSLDPLRAREYYLAIIDPNDGVLQWIQARW